MQLSHLQVVGFRNLQKQKIDFSPGINLIIGDNGQGKTNILEAIQLLSSCKSFRSGKSKDLISHGDSFSELKGLVLQPGVPLELRLVLNEQGRRLWMGGQVVHHLKDYLGCFKVVAFIPDDLFMIKGMPSLRRKFLDRSLFLFNPNHLDLLRSYHLALKSKNQLLRSRSLPDPALVAGFNRQLTTFGCQISNARKKFIQRIESRVHQIGMNILEGKQIRLAYISGWGVLNQEDPDFLFSMLQDQLTKEHKRHQAMHGSHLDDVEVLLDGKSTRRFSSQGQQRVGAVALLLAVVKEYVETFYEKPVILLDDVSSELDVDRRKHLFGQLMDFGGQILITTSDRALVGDLGFSISKTIQVKDGLASCFK